MTTAIIDLELGNIGSVSNMLKHIGQSVKLSLTQMRWQMQVVFCRGQLV